MTSKFCFNKINIQHIKLTTMTTLIKFIYVVGILIIITISAIGQVTKNVSLNFKTMIGDKPLILNDEAYKNASGEHYKVTTFNYFVSNLKFERKNGTAFTVPQDSSYFLVRSDQPASQHINLVLPKDEFISVSFILGVDSMRSRSDLKERTGVLDVSGGMLEGMYWTWNSGYIFFKLEGISDQAKPDMTGQHKFRYHIGGYGGYDKPSLNNIKTVYIDLSKGGIIDTKTHQHVNVNIAADLAKVFDGLTTISLAKESNIMFGLKSKAVASNYAEMFSHHSTTN